MEILEQLPSDAAEIAREMGWGEGDIALHMMDFIRERGLDRELSEHLNEAAIDQCRDEAMCMVPIR
jgi:hypothetical protein